MNNFEEYGFEEPKIDNIVEINILKKVSLEKCDELNYSRRKQYVYVGYVLCYDGLIPLEWNEDGESLDDDKYNLTPLKKQWYEEENNIGKLCITTDTHELFFLEDTIKDNCVLSDKDFVIGNRRGFNFCSIDYCRPATKEEVLKLVIKE